MIMEKRWMPDAVFGTFRDITPETIRALGGEAVFCDIDNTLASYEEPEPSPDVEAWAKHMADQGIRIILVSNNEKERVERFARPLGIPGEAKVRKPLKKPYRNVMKKYGLTPEKTVCLGDQLLTDVWAAKRFGMKALVVPPIRDKTTWFFRMKRAVEKPYMKKYRKSHPNSDEAERNPI